MDVMVSAGVAAAAVVALQRIAAAVEGWRNGRAAGAGGFGPEDRRALLALSHEAARHTEILRRICSAVEAARR